MMYDFLKKRAAKTPASEQVIDVKAETPQESPKVEKGIDERLKGWTPRFKAMGDRGKDWLGGLRQNAWVDELCQAGTGNVPLFAESVKKEVEVGSQERVESVPGAEAQAPAAADAPAGADAGDGPAAPEVQA